MTSQSFDVVVVGGGLSGLNAARLLQGKGLKVLVLEARDRVGGRTYSWRDKATGDWADLGGSYINPAQDFRLLKLIDELGLETYPASDGTLAALRPLFYSSGTARDLPYGNPAELQELQHIHSLMEAMWGEIPLETPWEAPRAHEWDHMTVKEFIDGVACTEVGRERGYRLTDLVFGCGPHEISLLGMLWMMKAKGGFQGLMAPFGPGERKVVSGSQSISEKLSQSLNVRLSSPVININQSDASIVSVMTSSGHVFNSRYVIVAIPPPIISRISFNPPLPAIKQQTLQRQAYLWFSSAMMEVVLFKALYFASVMAASCPVKQAFWRTELNRSGVMSTNGYPVTGTLDDTKPKGISPCITGFISSYNARKAASLTKQQRKDLVIKQYAETFKCDKFLRPVRYLECNWMAEEYTSGCYVSALAPGFLATFRDELRRPFGRVHFSGSESARHSMGFMEGALESAERATGEILNRERYQRLLMGRL